MILNKLLFILDIFYNNHIDHFRDLKNWVIFDSVQLFPSITLQIPDLLSRILLHSRAFCKLTWVVDEGSLYF